MVSTKIVLSKKDLTPPVYLAGTFTSWQPTIEMDVEESRDNDQVFYNFYKAVELSPGEHQYKFRLGPGDWWIHDENVEHVVDDQGFTNNVLTVSEDSSSHDEPSGQPSKQELRQQSSKPSLRWSSKSTESSNSSSSSDITVKETHALLRNQAPAGDGAGDSYGTMKDSRGRDTHQESTTPKINGHISSVNHKTGGRSKPPESKETSKTSIWHKFLCCFSAKNVIVLTALAGASIALYIQQGVVKSGTPITQGL